MLNHSSPSKQLCIMNSPTKHSDFDEGKAIEDGFVDELPAGMVVHSADKVAKTNSGKKKGSGMKSMIDKTIKPTETKIEGPSDKHMLTKASIPVKVLSESKFRTQIFTTLN